VMGPLLILGCGYTGSAVARRVLAQGREVVATVRSEESASPLREQLGGPHFTLLVAPTLDTSIGRYVTPETHVIIAFPPDGSTDARIAPALAAARAITYVSSTGVYGGRTGTIDHRTPLPEPASARAQRILDAESAYRAVGATVLRCPGIYGKDRGLHIRIVRGEHRIPGDGSRTLSRIHVEDLASFALAAGATRGETLVIGDREPARHIEVVRWVCDTYGVPLPPSVPWEEVHETLRADRCVDSSYAGERLGVALKYPTYREGMARD
jgi:nucleoside-diphosphate-sugar epimerase